MAAANKNIDAAEVLKICATFMIPPLQAVVPTALPPRHGLSTVPKTGAANEDDACEERYCRGEGSWSCTSSLRDFTGCDASVDDLR